MFTVIRLLITLCYKGIKKISESVPACHKRNPEQQSYFYLNKYYMTNASQLMFRCFDGHAMPVNSWVPKGETKAIVMVAHGMAEHSMRYARFANFLNEAGIAVYANDHRGHGKAVANNTLVGIPGDDWVNKQIDDIYALQFHIRKLHPGVKLFLMGHSMGSFFAQRYAELYSESIDGLILSGTNGYKDPLLPFGIGLSCMLLKWFGPSHRSRLIHKLTFGKFNRGFKPTRTQFDWLSRDPAEVDAYIADPFCGFNASVQMVYHLFVSLNETFDQKQIERIRKDLPVYVFAGERDPVGMEGNGVIKLIENWKTAGITNIEYRHYKDGRHEMLNEINREDVMNDCLNWLQKNITT